MVFELQSRREMPNRLIAKQHTYVTYWMFISSAKLEQKSPSAGSQGDPTCEAACCEPHADGQV